MSTEGPVCASGDRRRRLLGGARRSGMGRDAALLTGIDEVEVGPDQRVLRVSFLGPVPRGLRPEQIRIEGGRRVTGIRVLAVEVEPARPDRDEHLVLRLDRRGDFSPYRLRILGRAPGEGEGREAVLDPRYASAEFSFKIDCATGLDCAPEDCPSEPPRPSPEIAYTAKDYEGFRALMLDRLAQTLPAWRERHAPDLGITLVELLAFHADRLSYLQDAIAAEAYLETARRRVSVRRHLRLVGYRLHEGSNARALVGITVVDGDRLEVAAGDIAVAFGLGPAAPPGAMLKAEEVDRLPGNAPLWFELMADDPGKVLVFAEDRNRILFWTWGESECCLPRGATSATLRIASDRLDPGDILVFAEAKSPRTGREEDADPARRHPVRVVRSTPVHDPLFPDEALAEVEWDPADALPFALCLAGRLRILPCDAVADLAVAWGNVLLVDHGRTRTDELPEPPDTTEAACICDTAVTLRRLRPRWRPALPFGPVVHAAPLRAGLPATQLLEQDPAEAVPALFLDAREEDGPARWMPRFDLLRSGPEDRHVVLEPEDPPVLRFGDGRHGRAPEPGQTFIAHYRVGGGAAGNLPAGTPGHLVFRRSLPAGHRAEVTCLLPAVGGRDPEPLEQARRDGPWARHGRRRRAIVAEDYAAIAREDPALQGAAARLAWTGSWYAAEVALDPLGAETPVPELLRRVGRRLARARRVGHDLEIEAARPVPLDLALLVCARPEAVAGHVRGAVLEALSAGLRRDGRPGFFHPDRLQVGAPVRASEIVAEVMAVPGVATCRLDRLAHLSDARAPALPPDGILRLAPLEVARLRSDPSLPEEGRIALTVRGGR